VTNPPRFDGNGSVRIACIADTHLIVPDVKSAALFPRRLRALPLDEQSALYRKVALEVERAYESCVEEVAASEADAIIHLGDITSGWGRGGMGDSSVRDMAQRCAEDLKRLGKPLYCTLGNHDMGKVGREPDDLPLAADTYEAIFGPLFWQFQACQTLMIGMCSPLAYYAGNDERILKRKRDQEAFLGDTLAANRDKPWTLCVHDPFALGSVMDQIGPHIRRCRKIVVGHFHRPVAGRIVRSLARLPITAAVIRDARFRKALRKVIVAPSTAPLWYKGYGWLQADIEGSTVRLQRMEAARPHDSEKVPTRSLAWCLTGLDTSEEH
jgi:hypothetical protein